MKKYLTIVAAATIIVACSTEDEKVVENYGGYQPSEERISFDVEAEDAIITRTPIGEITDASIKSLTFVSHPLDNTDLRGFAAFASYTGMSLYESTTVSPNFMYNQQVTFNGASWEYEPVKYWPNNNSEYISFFAYAPYEPAPANDGRCIIDMSKSDETGDPSLVYRISLDPWNTDADKSTEPQVDLMYAFDNTDATKQAPWYDQRRKEYGVNTGNQRLKYTFAHALGCFADEVKLKIAPDMCSLLDGYSTININSLTMTYNNITSKARLSLNPLTENVTIGTDNVQIVQPNWKQIVSGEITTSRTTGAITNVPTADATDAMSTLVIDLTDATKEYLISEDRGLYYIPMQVLGYEKPTVTISINYTITITATGDTFTGDATKTIDLPLTYTLTSGDIVSAAGYKFGLGLKLSKDLDLLHNVYLLGGTAADPSYSRQW